MLRPSPGCAPGWKTRISITQSNPKTPTPRYGGLLEAFKFALDPDGSGCCRKEVLAPWLAIRIWVVAKIMVPFWIPIIIRHLIFRVPKKGP